MRRIAALVLSAVLLAASCSNDSTPSGPESDQSSKRVDLNGALPIAALQPFDACDDLLDHVRDAALDRVGPYGLDDGFTMVGGDVIFEEGLMLDDAEALPATGDVAAEPSADRVEGQDYSGTNVQEEGVDEADIVKTDGERVVTVQNGTVYLLDTTTAAPTIVDSVDLPGVYDAELFLHGDRVLVIGATDGTAVRGVDDDAIYDLVGPYGQATLLAEVDLSGDQQIELVSSQVVTGSYVSARAVDGTARVVLSAPGGELDWVQPSGPRAEDTAEAANRGIIEASTADDWLPARAVVDGSDADVDQGVPCDQVSRPPEFSGFGTTTILTVDLGQPLGDLAPVSILADAQTVYAGPEALYVATSRWPAFDADDAEAETPTTEIHKFDIGGDGAAVYEGSGAVRGELLNQFALSEHEGILRVATTDFDPDSGDSESFVTTLEDTGDELQQVGQVGDMGQGEQIFAVRFLGDVGYVVTFERTDPLYTLDLSDPADPQVVGELEMLGYSAYLHPVDDGHIIGVGQDATETGRTLGTQVSVFDVSDPAAPQRVAQYTLENSDSSVEFDHRAFLWWAPTDLAVVPVDTYGTGPSGAVGLTVTGDTIAELGLITHPGTSSGGGICAEDFDCEVFPCPPEADCIEPVVSYAAPILRSLVVDDQVWTLSTQGVQANDLSTLAPEGYVALAG